MQRTPYPSLLIARPRADFGQYCKRTLAGLNGAILQPKSKLAAVCYEATLGQMVRLAHLLPQYLCSFRGKVFSTTKYGGKR